MKNLDDKVAAVTGAGSGIGRALALELAAKGCHLALSDVDADGLAETERLLAGRARGLTTAVVDVADEAAVTAWADAVVADHGRANLVFNNAGVALSGTVASLSTEDYRWIMGVNFWGVVHGTKAFLPHLEASGAGHVVNISSVFGLTVTAADERLQRQQVRRTRLHRVVAAGPRAHRLVRQRHLRAPRRRQDQHRPGRARGRQRRRARRAQPSDAATREFEKAFITTPAKAAEVIVEAVRKNKRRVLVGPDARVFDAMARLAPAGYQRLITGVVRSRGAR